MKLTLKMMLPATAILALSLAASHSISASLTNAPNEARPTATPPASQTAEEQKIEVRTQNNLGIKVDKKLGVYDDALLQQMLQAAEARLASLQVIDQTQILNRLGATTGASQQISSFGVNVQGAPVPGVVTTTKLPTETTTQTTAPGATSSGVQTVTGLATQDVQTTKSAVTPPGSTAPAPTTTLPSSGFSVSSSDILNEQMQLTAEINGLRLLLAGDLSGQFINAKAGIGEGVTKLKTTLGFPITLSPDERYKDAVAIVEVEVSQPKKKEALENGVRQNVREVARANGDELSKAELDERTDPEEVSQLVGQVEDPMVTALLPREKTYNVAAITDKSVAIGGGVATQILGVSASWLRGNKTYYLVQDQDTVAKSFTPESSHSVGFLWEFRPVFGQRYVKAGLRQTFVQLAFAAPANAEQGEIGDVTFRTYWRRYDRKRGIPKEIIPGSLSKDIVFHIPRYSLAVRPPAFNGTNIEDVGGGQIMVNLKGRFLPGTYVRIGSKLLNTMPALLFEYAGMRFSAPIADLAIRNVFLVSHDGTEVPLTFPGCGITDLRDTAGIPIGTVTTRFIVNGDPVITPVDDTTSLVKLKFVVEETTRNAQGKTVATKNPGDREIPGLVMVVGDNVFGYSQLKREKDQLSALVPSAVLTPNAELSLQLLFPKRGCRPDPLPLAKFLPPRPERLVVLERGNKQITFLLYGNKLSTLKVLSPAGARIADIGTEPDKMRMLILTPANVASNKQVLLQRQNDKPFLVTIPELEPKKPDPPKARERVTVDSDEALIEGDGMKDLKSVTCITCKVKPVLFEVVDDKTVRLTSLKTNVGASGAATHTLVLQFKSGVKSKLNIEIVSTKVENVPK